jgi:hypothetical protein
LTGARNVDRINAAGNGSATVLGGSWTRGWSQLVAFKLAGVQHVMLYKGGTGEVRIIKITGSGDSVTISDVWSSTWATGWTHIVPIAHNGAVHLLRYQQATGVASYERIDADGKGVQHLGAEAWAADWSTMSPFSVGTQGHVLVYRTTGLAKVLKLNASGSDMTTIHTEGWTTGLA